MASGAAFFSDHARAGRRGGLDADDSVPWAQPTQATAPRGREVLEKQLESHGSRERWLALPPLVCDLEVAWMAAARMVLPAIPEIQPGASLAVNFEADKVRLDFNDAGDTRWGFDSREAWSSRGDDRTYGQLHQVDRIVRILAWYASMPHKLLDPDVLHRVVDGTSDSQVAIGFGTSGGQTGDQMLAYFASGRLIRLRHTARGLGAEVRAEARFMRWQAVRGVQLPAEVSVSLEAPMAVVDAQVMRYRNWRPYTKLPSAFEKPVRLIK